MSKENTRKFIIEGFLIVFSVMLALALDSWNENRKLQKLVDDALIEIFNEVSMMNSIQGVTAYNTKILSQLDSILKVHENSPESFKAPIGLGRPELRNLAWNSAKESGIASGFNPEMFRDLAEVYIEYERLEKILDYNREFTLKSDPNMDRFTEAKHVRKQLDQSIFRSEELIKKSGEFLEKYKDSKYATH